MGRDTLADKTPLLQNAEQNIGNSATLIPQLGPTTVIPQPTPGEGPRLLQLTGGSQVGQMTSVVLTASRILGANPPGTGGPVTAVLEFGNGGRSTRAEVDVPIGPYVGHLNVGTSAAQEPQDGGIIVTLPTGVLRIYMRYDNLLLQPVLGTDPPQSVAQILGIPVLGPNFRFPVSEPVLVKAMAAYFTRHFSRAYRTHYCFLAPLPPAVPFQLPANSRFAIPAFAQSVKVLRMPVVPLTVNLYDNVGNQLDQVALLAGSSPDIELTGTVQSVEIVNTFANAIFFLALAYEIGL